jgi:Putative peptidoglycan binding domain
MRSIYRRRGLTLRRASGPPDPLVKALQRDLRSLGYLRIGIDGWFGPVTERAVRALQFDLLYAGRHGNDGDAPVAIRTFNRGRVAAVTGVVGERLAACIEDMTSGTQADDRLSKIGWGALRTCRYSQPDPRYLTDCARCAAERLVDIGPSTPLYPGTTATLHPTPYHPETAYSGVPERSRFGCDWPYAVRRYNGSGVNSYHYQYQVLQRLRQSRRSSPVEDDPAATARRTGPGTTGRHPRRHGGRYDKA